VYISANVNPKTGEPLLVEGEQRWEIFRGSTRDGGASWKWKPVTKNSTENNIRPIVLDYNGDEVVIWLRGRYTTYRDYDLEVMGLVPRQTHRHKFSLNLSQWVALCTMGT